MDALFDVVGCVWAKVRAVSFLACRLALFQLQFIAPDARRRQRGAFALGLEAFVSVPPADLDPAPLDAF